MPIIKTEKDGLVDSFSVSPRAQVRFRPHEMNAFPVSDMYVPVGGPRLGSGGYHQHTHTLTYIFVCAYQSTRTERSGGGAIHVWLWEDFGRLPVEKKIFSHHM